MARRTVIGTLFARSPVFTTVILGGTAFLAYLGLRKLFRPGIPSAPRITAGKAKGLPQGWSPYPLAAALHNDMEGVNWGVMVEPQSWVTLSGLPTDDMVIAVYEAFNQQYFNEGNGTLTEWIRDEGGGTYRKLVLARLTSLQLP